MPGRDCDQITSVASSIGVDRIALSEWIHEVKEDLGYSANIVLQLAIKQDSISVRYGGEELDTIGIGELRKRRRY